VCHPAGSSPTLARFRRTPNFDAREGAEVVTALRKQVVECRGDDARGVEVEQFEGAHDEGADISPVLQPTGV
jgi:hypothetical protein